MQGLIQSVLIVSPADYNGETGTIAEEGGVSFQEGAPFPSY